MDHWPSKVLSIISVIALSLGGLVYIFDRSPGSAYLMPDWFSLDFELVNLFGTMGYHLPSFVHVYTFILLTSVCLLPSKRQLVFVCIAWLLIDILFEVAQGEPISNWIANGLADSLVGIPILENLSNYFLCGTFDLWDIYSIASGAIAAYVTVQYVTKKSKDGLS